MNYRHAYHAGNFADVLKHAALMSIILHLKKKPTPFVVIDTHGGRGLYDLEGIEAKKTGEAEEGVKKLFGQNALPGVLKDYLGLVKEFAPKRYPGSPVIALRLLRENDRLIAIEKHPEEYETLKAAASDARARAILGDAYQELARLLPPKERRGVILIDPPYERESEFAHAVKALSAAYRRFATGIYLLWYPAKARSDVAAAAGELANGVRTLLQIELAIGQASSVEERPGMNATGLFVVNPPFGFAEEMQALLPFLVEHLGRGEGASGILKWLSGGD